MPELPEVETILRGLSPRLLGRKLLNVEILHRRIVRHCAGDLARELAGATVSSAMRHGKFLQLGFDGNQILTMHLGMTGQLKFDAEPSVHTRAIFHLDGGTLLYDDIRMFGSLELGGCRVAELGPDALNEHGWSGRLSGRKTSVKAALLNQHLVAGLGNIYVDEALFRAQIHPRLRANKISRLRLRVLEEHTRGLLLSAIEHRGSSISDYVDTAGRSGSFQDLHRVYGREEQPCPECRTAIRKAWIAGRGTHWCPKCQRR